MGGIVDSAHSDHCWLNGIDRGTFLVAMETDLGGRATSPASAGTSGGNQRGLGLAAQVGDELVTAVASRGVHLGFPDRLAISVWPRIIDDGAVRTVDAKARYSSTRPSINSMSTSTASRI
ncbi:hypothetical protein BDB13_6015 [Rhodococcus sp. OK302]|nr:hypothetical protein BDB13_6015 [Rhodococcus sp. OK302]